MESQAASCYDVTTAFSICAGVMAANNQEEGELEGSPERDQGPRETGPYILRNLIEDLPLSADGESQDIDINCVEYLGT